MDKLTVVPLDSSNFSLDAMEEHILSLALRHFKAVLCFLEQEAPISQKILGNILEKVTWMVYNYFNMQLI